MEIVFLDKEDRTPIYSFQHKLDWNDRIRYDAPAKLDPPTLERLKSAARAAFMALGCRDVARIDFRMDEKGRIYFIECNPLPGLTPGWSDLVLIAQAAGMDYRTLIGEILTGAIRRYKEREPRRTQDGLTPGVAPPRPEEKGGGVTATLAASMATAPALPPEAAAPPAPAPGVPAADVRPDGSKG
jgi:D-alanine-D-alanine ligase